MTVDIVPTKPAPEPRYRSGCRGCGTTFEFDEGDAVRSYSFPNHSLALACPKCGARLVWTLPPIALSAAP
jgi:DNA-directed RNA polymerase subunit RPC12/RpoP